MVIYTRLDDRYFLSDRIDSHGGRHFTNAIPALRYRRLRERDIAGSGGRATQIFNREFDEDIWPRWQGIIAQNLEIGNERPI